MTNSLSSLHYPSKHLCFTVSVILRPWLKDLAGSISPLAVFTKGNMRMARDMGLEGIFRLMGVIS